MRGLRLAVTVVVLVFGSVAEAGEGMVVGDQIAGVGWPQQVTHGARAYALAVSPDGKWIAFAEQVIDFRALRNAAEPQPMDWRLSVVAATGGTPRVLVDRKIEGRSLYPNPQLKWCSAGSFLAFTAPQGTSHASELIVCDLRTWQTQALSSSDSNLITFFWQPHGTWLVWRVNPLETSRTQDPSRVLVWNAATNVSEDLGPGSLEHWTEDGRRVSYWPLQESAEDEGGFRFKDELEYDPVTRQTIRGSHDIRGRPDAERTATSADGRFVAAMSFDEAANSQVLTVTDSHGGTRRVVSREANSMFGWARGHNLLLYTRMLYLQDDVRHETKGGLFTLWVLNPERAREDMLVLASEILGNAAWVGDTLRVCYLHLGDVWVSEITLIDPTPEERSRYGMALTEEQKFQLAESRMRDVSVGLQMMLSGADPGARSTQPGDPSETIAETIEPFLRNNDSLAAPGGEALVSFLIGPGQMVQGRPNPQEVPLAFLAWPSGYVFAALLDGSVRRFTDAQWDVFTMEARAAGNWPPDWHD